MSIYVVGARMLANRPQQIAGICTRSWRALRRQLWLRCGRYRQHNMAPPEVGPPMEHAAVGHIPAELCRAVGPPAGPQGNRRQHSPSHRREDVGRLVDRSNHVRCQRHHFAAGAHDRRRAKAAMGPYGQCRRSNAAKRRA